MWGLGGLGVLETVIGFGSRSALPDSFDMLRAFEFNAESAQFRHFFFILATWAVGFKV